MKHALVLIAMLLAACGSGPDIEKSYTVNGNHRFSHGCRETDALAAPTLSFKVSLQLTKQEDGTYTVQEAVPGSEATEAADPADEGTYDPATAKMDVPTENGYLQTREFSPEAASWQGTARTGLCKGFVSFDCESTCLHSYAITATAF